MEDRNRAKPNDAVSQADIDRKRRQEAREEERNASATARTSPWKRGLRTLSRPPIR